jgi:hypothetical protein
MMVHAGAQIDDPLGPLDQGGQNIGRQRVDREHMGQAVSGDAMAFAIADGGVVDQSVETAKLIDLGRYISSARDGFDVADRDRHGLGQFLASCFGRAWPCEREARRGGPCSRANRPPSGRGRRKIPK